MILHLVHHARLNSIVQSKPLKLLIKTNTPAKIVSCVTQAQAPNLDQAFAQ